MKKITLLFLLLLFGFTAFSQESPQHKIDSLRKIIVKQHGKEKVDNYALLGSYLFQSASLEDMITYFEEYETVILQEQKKEKEKSLLSYYSERCAQLKLNHGYVLFNTGDFEGVEKQARAGMAYCDENEIRGYYYIHFGLLIDALMALQKYETLQREVKKLYAEAKEKNEPEGMFAATFALAGVYMKLHRFADAEKYYREAIDWANQLYFRDVLYQFAEAYRNLAAVVISQEKYSEVLPILQKAEQVVQKLEENEAEIGHVGSVDRYYLYGFFVEYYLKINDIHQAEHYCKLMENILRSISEDETVFDDRFFLLRAKVLEAQGQYSAALEMAEKTYLIMLEQESIPINMNDILLLKAKLLIQVGRGKESIAIYDSVFARTNRIRDIDFNAQLDELRTVYEVDKITAEKERNRNYFLFALGGCILLSIALGIWIYHSRTIVRKNRGLFSQIKAQDRMENELEAERRKNLELHLLLKPEAVVLEENEENLDLFFGKLTILMKEQRLFIDSEIKRKDVALQIGISDRGLHDCIKNSTGMSFTEYINTLRLAYSRELLTNMDEKFTIDAIAYESGFNSRTTFYRLFNKKYGLSPKQFREVSRA